MFVQIILIIVGFVLLIKGSDFFIDGTCSIAKKYNISDFIIGMTIVAFGTSAPELAVSIISAIKGSSGIALGNILGSNIANLLLILGVAGLIKPISIDKNISMREIPFALIVAIVLLVIVMFNNNPFIISRPESIILISGIIAYIFFMLMPSQQQIIPEAETHQHNLFIAILITVGGLIALIYGGDMVVGNASKIAHSLGVSNAMIGLTIVALGTSLPELAASIAAIKKKKSGIVIGNIIGSNILNTCLVLGSAAVIKPLTCTKSFTFDAAIAAIAALIIFLFMFIGKKHYITRGKAFALIILYAAYIGYVVYRK